MHGPKRDLWDLHQAYVIFARHTIVVPGRVEQVTAEALPAW